MYKISYEKCVCFVFLVILAFLSCSGFHIDKMIPLPDHNKKYPFTSTNFNESAYVSDFNNSNSNNSNNNHQQHHHHQHYQQQYLMDQSRKFWGGDVRGGVPREHLVGALPLQELQRVYEKRRKRRIRTARSRTHVERKNDSDLTRQVKNDRRNPSTNPKDYDPERERRAPERQRGQRRERKNRFCTGQDVATRAYQAKTVLEGKIRSKTKLPNLTYNVTYEVKLVLKNQTGFRPFVKNESIRLQFANDRGMSKTGTCDFRKIHGVVVAHFNYSKNYVLFADRIGDHEYKILGPPVESNKKNIQEIRNILDGKVEGKLWFFSAFS